MAVCVCCGVLLGVRQIRAAILIYTLHHGVDYNQRPCLLNAELKTKRTQTVTTLTD